MPNDPTPEDLPYAIQALRTVAQVLAAGGFAANQLGFSVRVVIIRMDDATYQIFNNPTFEPVKSDGLVYEAEHCFSIPRFSAKVERWASIKVKWMSEFGEYKEGTMTGDEARIMQHEVDHLDGILISDLADFGQNKIKRIRRQFKKSGYAYTVNELGELGT